MISNRRPSWSDNTLNEFSLIGIFYRIKTFDHRKSSSGSSLNKNISKKITWYLWSNFWRTKCKNLFTKQTFLSFKAQKQFKRVNPAAKIFLIWTDLHWRSSKKRDLKKIFNEISLSMWNFLIFFERSHEDIKDFKTKTF